MRFWANNVLTQNTVILNPADLTLVVQDDSTFPNNTVGGFNFGAGDTFLLTLRSSLTAASPNEIVEVTGNPAGTSYTITRAQEGTTAQQWVVGSVVAGQLTAAPVNEFEQGTGTVNPVNTGDSILGDGDATPLDVNFGPDVFGLGGNSILLDNTDDLDTITETGLYSWIGSSVPTNAPTVGAAGGMLHIQNSSGRAFQIVIGRNSLTSQRQRTTSQWLLWNENLSIVASNNTLVGQGTTSSPLGVNTNVFETDINTDTSLFGSGESGNLLSVAGLQPALVQTPGNLTIDLAAGNFVVAESYINFTGSGSDFDLTIDVGVSPQFGEGPQGRKVHIVNHSDATATVIAGTGVSWIDSPVGSNVDIPPNSGLITILVTLDFAEDVGLAFQGAVVATP